MARAGIYKSEVLRARDRLIAQGRHPSIDAVRVELGNTGSKTTISRYLKEIEEEEGGRPNGTTAVSESILELVSRLAERLHEEADERLRDQAARHDAILQSLRNDLAAAQSASAAFRDQLERAQLALDGTRKELEAGRAAGQEQATRCAQLQQQVADFQDRLTETGAQVRSLEALHQNARDALEHFRQAAKEQREQAQRQHDQQIAFLQTELRTQQETSNRLQQQQLAVQRETSELANELKATRTKLLEAEARVRSLATQSEQHEEAEQRMRELERRLVDREHQLKRMDDERRKVIEENRAHTDQLRETTAELAALRSAGSVHDQLFAKLEHQMKTLMDQASGDGKSTHADRKSGRRKTSVEAKP